MKKIKIRNFHSSLHKLESTENGVNDISKKISAGLSVLKRISPTTPFETRQIMYKALILPYFDYCSCVWDI